MNRRLAAIGDGERDRAMTPALVERLLDARFDWHFQPWKRLHGKGYDKKLLFALVRARADGCAGLVAVVDQDDSSSSERLRELRRGRARDREERPALPAALGCADPHAEAWLLDDAVAVREALGLPPAHPVPNPARVREPKQELTALHATSSRTGDAPPQVCAEIAARLDLARCAHRRETGLEAFAREVDDELRPLVTAGRA